MEQNVYSTQGNLVNVKSLEGYIDEFGKRYRKDEKFQEGVHKYLKLDILDRVGLSFFSVVSFKSYEAKVNNIINRYSSRVRADAIAAREIQEKLNKLSGVRKTFEESVEILNESGEVFNETSQTHSSIINQKNSEINGINSDSQSEELKISEISNGKVNEVIDQTDIDSLVRDSLNENLANSGYLQKDSNGNFQYNEGNVVKTLEDMFLNEIVEGIESEGETGFMSKLQASYDGVMTHSDYMDDLSELPHINWTDSIIASRTRGYRTPKYPYFMTNKFQGRSKSSLDTAITLDTSGSMVDNNRFEVAQKTCLAIHSLMRQLNPNNETYLSHYNSNSPQEITTRDLMKSISPGGGTNTDLALGWLFDKLKDIEDPSIAYLITDGEPNSKDRCIEVAQKFRSNPQIMLRMFLVDPNENSRNIIREIGLAAGENTKVVPIDNYNLGSGVITDISECLQNMYDIASF